MKLNRYFNPISCSGMTDPDLPSLEKCPFYAEDWNICAFTGRDIEDAMTVPEDCILRMFSIEVNTDVLNQMSIDDAV